MSRKRNTHSIRIVAVLLAVLAAAYLTACACPPSEEASVTPTTGGYTDQVATLPPSATFTPVPVALPTPTLSGPTILHLEPSAVEMTVGQAQRVQVLLENVEGLYGVELHISFDPQYLAVDDANPNMAGIQIEAGTLPAPDMMMQNEVSNGFIMYYVAQGEGSAARGSGVVASFTLRALTAGVIPLRFTVVKLYGSDGRELLTLDAEKIVDGMAIISPGDAGPAPTQPAGEPQPTVPAPSGDRETVQQGDTLYQVCRRHCPNRWSPNAPTFDAELKAYAEQVAQLNGLGWPDPLLQPGQSLQMPPCP